MTNKNEKDKQIPNIIQWNLVYILIFIDCQIETTEWNMSEFIAVVKNISIDDKICVQYTLVSSLSSKKKNKKKKKFNYIVHGFVMCSSV